MTDPTAAESAPVREGDILAGKYRVEKVLGVGGMGVVVAAMHLELDQRVALKFLLKSAAENPAVVARFSREARAAAKIKSQHVARVSDVGTLENGIPYIVMEHLEGCDLSDLLVRQGPLPPGAAVDYVLQACEAIAEAHAAGFIHRDLKPSNLFLARQADGVEIVKVLDFGISKAVIIDSEPTGVKQGALTGTTDIFGSPQYMSPEQLKSSRDVDARSDIWALGTILYELCTGTSPFDRPTVAETFGAILYEKPVPLRKRFNTIPEALDAVILRCLEKDASLRFGNVAELAKALFPFAERSTKHSIERTSGVLRRAGVRVDSVPPPSRIAVTGAGPLGGADAGANQPVGASTRLTWGPADRAAKPRSGARFVLAGAGLAVVLALGFVAVTRLVAKPPRVAPAAPVDQPVTTQTAAPLPTVAPKPSVAPVATAPSTPTVEASPTASVAATGAPVRGKLPPHGSKTPPPVTPPPSTPTNPQVAPPRVAPPPPKPPEDPDGFGDRK
jgi:serine/threonine-protein kinase